LGFSNFRRFGIVRGDVCSADTVQCRLVQAGAHVTDAPSSVAKSPDRPRVALVVPCYNEAQRLDSRAFTEFLGLRPEIIVILVNDGSTDQTAALLASMHASLPARILVINQEVNQGKAEAVRVGMLAAIDLGAENVGFWDADLATPLEEVFAFTAVLAERPEVDFVLGARIGLLGRDIDRKASRHYLGRVFATGASLTLNLPVYDTQCGAKLLRVRPYTRSLFEQRFGSRWIFDVELIARFSVLLGGSRGIYEHALSRWHDVAESKVKPVDFLRAIGEMLQIYRAYALNQPMRRVVLFVASVFSIYALVGAIGTGFHFFTLIVGVELLGMATVAAAITGATVGALANYVMNYHMTFASRQRHVETLPKFALVAVLGILVSGAGARLANRLGIHYLLAQVACTAIVLGLGFVLNRFWTFAAKPE
jgi:dolichyl-phosphate beta-glucosyltransferase